MKNIEISPENAPNKKNILIIQLFNQEKDDIANSEDSLHWIKSESHSSRFSGVFQFEIKKS
jgi:hypothetical protein